MIDELKHDYNTSMGKKLSNTPLYHRIKFNSASIYLTESNTSRIMTGKTGQGDYRVFSWIDPRAKAFLGFELGDNSPLLGRANLIGSFKPSDNDLKEVKYHSFSGKAYFPSAYDELNNIGKNPNLALKELIDVDNFMKMSEIIPTGVQGKAIYGEGNYIIDGAAGTGKSTTVLQKIKLLQNQNNVLSSQIAVVVKSKQVIETFKTLLNSLDVKGIALYSQSEFVQHHFSELSSLTSTVLTETYDDVKNKIEIFEELINIDSAIKSKSIENTQPFPSLSFSNSLERKVTHFLNLCRFYSEGKNNLHNSLVESKERKNKQIAEFKRKLESSLLSKKLQDMIRKEEDVSGGVHLDLGDEAIIREKTFKYESELQKKIKELEDKNNSTLNDKITKIRNMKKDIRIDFCSSENISSTFDLNVPSELISLYLNEHYPHKESLYHSVIIDEAQDIPSNFIELVRLNSKNTILAGDESQTESSSGIGFWRNIILFEEKYSIDNEPNIYNLRHNFRQTYELGAVSFNFRQLILGREIDNIKQDYYENQIGFNKPELVRISQVDEFYKLVDAKIDYIKNNFTSSFPLVVFYESDSSLTRFKELFTGKYKYIMDQDEASDSEIMLVSTEDISGREFPVVISPLLDSTLESTIYIILSRAKFDLSIVISNKLKLNDHLKTLIDENYIHFDEPQKGDLGW